MLRSVILFMPAAVWYLAAAELGHLGTHLGFNQCNIHRVDQTIRIHVSAEVRTGNRLTYLRLGQTDIGGIDDGIAIHITD